MSNLSNNATEGKPPEKNASEKNPMSAPDYPPAPSGDQVMALRRDGTSLPRKRA